MESLLHFLNYKEPRAVRQAFPLYRLLIPISCVLSDLTNPFALPRSEFSSVQFLNDLFSPRRDWLLAARLYGWKEAVSPFLPIFLAAILVEFVISALVFRKKVYYTRQTLSNLWAGILSMTLGVFVRGLSIFPYKYMYDRFCIMKPGPEHIWFHAYQVRIA